MEDKTEERVEHMGTNYNTSMFLSTSYVDVTADLPDRLLPFSMDLPTHGVQNWELLKEENWWEEGWLKVQLLPHIYKVR